MLILASKSPTRKTLLENAGLQFETLPAQIEERAIEQNLFQKGGSKKDIASALALAKARVLSEHYRQAIVIGADQVLECGDLVIHKPHSKTEAAAQLRQMAGRTHYLHSAVALAQDGQILWQTVESAELRLKPFNDTEVERVLELEGDAILSSVGGYRLEGPSVRLFESIRGDYFTILGLPLLPLLDALDRYAPDALNGGDD